MLAFATHDVRIIAEKREKPPVEGWACWELTGTALLECSCGHTDGPMVTRLAPLMARLHISAHA
ncbi:hypothetical protein ACFW9O_25030 [Streptomyces sp. NPDC059499]|uniref:hypothetical protein n=1 Tax=Streptomyces sp. NPDC059499 TaxID=3346852 RepID=UPI0036C0361E